MDIGIPQRSFRNSQQQKEFTVGTRNIPRTTAMTEQCQSLRDNMWAGEGVRGNATRKAAFGQVVSGW